MPDRPARAFGLLLAVALVASASPTRARIDCPTPQLIGAPVPVTTGPNPLFIASADFDEDGDIDLAVTNSHYTGGGSQATVAILRNNGFGAFTVVATYPVAANPHGIVTCDLNEDGILDLAVACRFASQICILRGQGAGSVGDGTFAPAVAWPAGGGPFQIVAGDFNGDGHADLAAAINDAARVAIYRGLGDGTIGAPLLATIGNLATGLVTGDFNSDGILDLVATENYSGRIALLRGSGTNSTVNGGFAPAVTFAAGIEPFDLEILDFDEDGILDLAVANGNLGGTVVLRGNGSDGVAKGTFTLAATLSTGTTAGLAVLDADGDGIVDLVAAESVLPFGRRLHVLRGQGAGGVGDGTFAPAVVLGLPSFPYQVIAADLNGDAFLDLVVTEYQSDRIELLRGGCGGAFPDARSPYLTDVRDVPADEGGHVYVTWLRSGLDVTGGAVTSYRVWQRIPGELATPADGPSLREVGGRLERVEAGPDGRLFVTFWEHVATLAAERLEGYGYTATTSEDSSAIRPVSVAFFVTAATANIDVFYPSNVDSGASVDNLAPAAPAGLMLLASSPAGRTLRWGANAEPDVESYRLERAPSPAFAPGEVVVMATQADTEYVDTDLSAASYRVIALDRSRNPSPPSAVVNAGGVGVATATRLALAGTYPHPARAGSLRIAFSLADGGPARLELFDARGRRVASRSLDGQGAGDHSVSFDSERRFAPGLYWARLVQGAARVERAIVVID